MTQRRWPDLRHVRYVALSAAPPGHAPAQLPFMTRCLAAIAGGSVAMQWSGRASVGLLAATTIGAATFLPDLKARRAGRGFALVPWGVLLDGDEEVTAIRWSGVQSLDVRYRASRDGSVHACVAVDSVVGSFVGYASDAVDLGALAGNLEEVAAASARPIALDLDGSNGASDGEPFVERVLDAARTLVASEGEGDHYLGLEPSSYRELAAPSAHGSAAVARTLTEFGTRARGVADVWALLAAVAGELRLGAFANELARLVNAPHPGVAAFARAALGRMPRAKDEDDDDGPEATEDGGALAWFVSPDELARLRTWRDAPA